MADWIARGAAMADALEQAGDDTLLPAEQRVELIEILRGLMAHGETAELLLEVKIEELNAVREVLSTIAYPVITVKPKVLCLPIVGPIDAQVMRQVADDLLSAASTRQARRVIVDLTGAVLADGAAASLLSGLFDMLRLLGVRGSLCGVSPALAVILAGVPERLGVPVYSSLALALEGSV